MLKGSCSGARQAQPSAAAPCPAREAVLLPGTHSSCNTLSWAATWGCTSSSEPAQILCAGSVWLPMKVQDVIFWQQLVEPPLLALSAQVIFRCKWFVSEKCFIFAREGCSLKSVCFPQPVLKIIRRSTPKSVWRLVIRWCEKCDIANL